MDDLLTGTDDIKTALSLCSQLNSLLDKEDFLLRKWRSNSTELLHAIPEDLREKEQVTELKLVDCPKRLGIHWDTSNDTCMSPLH